MVDGPNCYFLYKLSRNISIQFSNSLKHFNAYYQADKFEVPHLPVFPISLKKNITHFLIDNRSSIFL